MKGARRKAIWSRQCQGERASLLPSSGRVGPIEDHADVLIDSLLFPDLERRRRL